MILITRIEKDRRMVNNWTKLDVIVEFLLENASLQISSWRLVKTKLDLGNFRYPVKSGIVT